MCTFWKTILGQCILLCVLGFTKIHTYSTEFPSQTLPPPLHQGQSVDKELGLKAKDLTQVPRAAEYFRRWVAKWPTVANLAAATEGEVNEMWAGLGYYR